MALIKCAHCGKHENINKAIDMESEGYFCSSCGQKKQLTQLIMEAEISKDTVIEHPTSPEHYVGKYKYIRAIDVVQDFELTHNLANAVEYILRAGKKPGNSIDQDLRKAVDHLQFELNFLSLHKKNNKDE